MDGTFAPRVIHVAETGSTNADAMRLALAGEHLPFWVIADTQTGGKGRSGRDWISYPGNLHASLAFACAAPLGNAGQLSLVAGISAVDAIRATMELAPSVKLRLKWPNDILIGFAKTGGILVESTSWREGPGFLAIVGFGLNLVAFPDAIEREVTALGQHGRAPGIRDIIPVLSNRISFWLGQWNGGSNVDIIREAWVERAGPVGEAITINTTAGQVSATYRGLGKTGALLADVDGVLKEFNYGDVALVADVASDGDS
jgi:BirA family biotin operon repressor/biotin-[acetyl-CoA-carboxylase] ligase